MVRTIAWANFLHDRSQTPRRDLHFFALAGRLLALAVAASVLAVMAGRSRR
ncbi:MAG: hypothetical protein ACREHD_06805 [Pirellulales bacterium]